MKHLATLAINRIAIRRTFSDRVILKSLVVALVVGTVLNAINQGIEFAEGKAIDVWKIVLTYVVPFFVASYGAYSAFKEGHALYVPNSASMIGQSGTCLPLQRDEIPVITRSSRLRSEILRRMSATWSRVKARTCAHV